MNENKKPIIRYPGDTRLLDGTQPVIFVGPAIALAIFGFVLFVSLGYLAVWRNLPFLPLPKTAKPVLYHLYAYFAMWAGAALHLFQGTTYHHYLSWIQHNSIENERLFEIRWLIATVGGLAGGCWFFKMAWQPTYTERQIRGRKLLEDKEGYNDLKREFAYQLAQTKIPGLVMLSDVGLDPNKPSTYVTNKPAEKITVPDTQRRSHKVIVGGSGRGKTQVILGEVMQIVNHIKFGENYKLLLVDTPKADYSRFIPKGMVNRIAPDEKSGVAHAIGQDLLLTQDIQQFWAGKIPEPDKDAQWTNAARAIGSGVAVHFSKIGGTDWTYANLVWGLTQQPEVLIVLLEKTYPEALQILRSADTTIASVLFNLAAYTQDLFQLARIWDGYDYKHDILQFNVALMKKPKALSWWLDKLYPRELQTEAGTTPVPFNKTIQELFKGLVAHLNSVNANWCWSDLAKVQALPFEEQVVIANKYLDDQLKPERTDINYYAKAIHPIAQWAKIWDEYESQPRFSVREWVLNESPEKKILCLSPSGRFKEMSDGMIRGLLYFMTGLIDDKYLCDDKSDECELRRFYIVCDEFQSRGKMKEFIEPILERGRSKGITLILACQDLAQLKSVYDDHFVKFLQANTGNFIVLGVNAGTTADEISNLVGKKTISKLHTSQTLQADGRSSSINYQEHEGLILTPDECNSKLGVEFVKGVGCLRYLYLPGLLPNAYILSTPLVKYEVVYKPQAPEWMKGEVKQPVKITTEQVQKHLLNGSGGVKVESTDEPVPDAASELDFDDFEPSPEEEEVMAQAIRKEEIKPIYRMPSEQEDLLGQLGKETGIELVGGAPLSAINTMAEIFQTTKTVTISKKKYLDAWKEKNYGQELTKGP